LYNDYLPKISELKNQMPKLKNSNLNNYLAVCCLNGKDTTVRISRVQPLEKALSGTPCSKGPVRCSKGLT